MDEAEAAPADAVDVAATSVSTEAAATEAAAGDGGEEADDSYTEESIKNMTRELLVNEELAPKEKIHEVDEMNWGKHLARAGLRTPRSTVTIAAAAADAAAADAPLDHDHDPV